MNFMRTMVGKGTLGLMLSLVSPLFVPAQSTLSLWDRIERSIAQSEPRWILADKWPNPNPKVKVITFRWQSDTGEILVWMIELPTSEDAAREFYNLARPTVEHPLQQCSIGDKCYFLGTSGDLFFRKGTLVVRIMKGDSTRPADVQRLNTLARFAGLIASEVPADQPRLARSPVEPSRNARMRRELAARAMRESRYQEAIDQYKMAIELDADSPELHHALGLAYMKLGDRTKATDAFKEAIRLRPGWAEAHYDLARAYYEVGEYQTAATSFEEAIRLKPDFFEALVALGKTYQHSGLHLRSVEVLQKAVLLRPTHVDTKCALATAFILSGQPQEAVTVLREAVRLSPQSALAYSTLGRANRLLGKFQESLGALQEALRISPEDPGAYNDLGMTYESLQLQQDALAAYKQALALKPDYAEAHYNVAWLYFTLGDRNQAQHHYESLKTISPDLAEALSKKLSQ